MAASGHVLTCLVSPLRERLYVVLLSSQPHFCYRSTYLRPIPPGFSNQYRIFASSCSYTSFQPACEIMTTEKTMPTDTTSPQTKDKQSDTTNSDLKSENETSGKAQQSTSSQTQKPQKSRHRASVACASCRDRRIRVGFEPE